MERVCVTTRKMLANTGLVGALLGSGLASLIGARRESAISGGMSSSGASEQRFDWLDESI